MLIQITDEAYEQFKKIKERIVEIHKIETGLSNADVINWMMATQTGVLNK